MTLSLESDVSPVARRQLGAMREALAFNFQVDEFEDKATGQSVLRLWKPSQAAAAAAAKAQAQVSTGRLTVSAIPSFFFLFLLYSLQHFFVSLLPR